VKPTLLVAALAFALLSAGSASATATRPPIATVVRHGGLCLGGSECRTVFRITDTTISAPGYVPRRLAPADRLALLPAVKLLNLPYLRAHPFTGTCPTAYDGSASIYVFRGFARRLPSCTYDVRGVRAVRIHRAPARDAEAAIGSRPRLSRRRRATTSSPHGRPRKRGSGTREKPDGIREPPT